MKRAEIKAKFDEIVAFSGVEKFIDIPVKHYSSGMYVRLAFAVAAHLESEILLIDEVLAVGDAEFQKKCLGKMQEIAQQRCTTIFVSHNLQAISTITQQCILIQQGSLSYQGLTTLAIKEYLGTTILSEYSYYNKALSSTGIVKVNILSSLPNNVQVNGEKLQIHLRIKVTQKLTKPAISLQFMNEWKLPIVHLWLIDNQSAMINEIGEYELVCEIPKLHLYMGTYTITINFNQTKYYSEKIEFLEDICPFSVVMYGKERDYKWDNGTCTYLEENTWCVNKL